ncbi:MAG: DEAD/DEAH box helicase [Candidatus Marinimicrobia bacterium]|nr:DEAD/DEAH box helicase [Candidatus Neomarinimicrobiota bacterium]
MKFVDFDIAQEIKTNLTNLGFVRPTDIQYKAIPSILNGEDVLAIAQTGTGKTAAFAIPIINKIHSFKRNKSSKAIEAIVMVPTRELAQQIGQVFNKLCSHTRVKALAIIGGVEQDGQIDRLIKGIDVLIATPGRMFDLISQGYIALEEIRTLVLDEADRMLDLGFIEDIKSIKKKLKRRHQTLFFSATINEEIKKLAYSQVRSNAIRIQISPENPVSKNVFHYVMFVEMDDKRFFLERFVRENPDSKILVFVRTKVRAERVAKAMERVEIQSLTLHGDKAQLLRTEAMTQFKEGKSNILIATDVSARGIDIPMVNFVINYDLPTISENYVHRVGRTGRAFNKGIAITFCAKEEREKLEEIQGFLNKKIEEIKITKKDYYFTLNPEELEYSLNTLIDEKEVFHKKKRDKAKEKGKGKVKVKAKVKKIGKKKPGKKK